MTWEDKLVELQKLTNGRLNLYCVKAGHWYLMGPVGVVSQVNGMMVVRHPDLTLERAPEGHASPEAAVESAWQVLASGDLVAVTCQRGCHADKFVRVDSAWQHVGEDAGHA